MEFCLGDDEDEEDDGGVLVSAMQFEDKNLIHPPIAHRGSISMN